MFFCNLFRDGALFEETAQSEASVPVKVDERAAKTLASLMQIQSFELAHCLAAVFMAGVTQGERSVRGVTAAGKTGARAARAAPRVPDQASDRTP
jgi:hypothetical protein